MTDEQLVERMLTVFKDTPEIASWYEQDECDSYDYWMGETRTHLLGMWETMQEAAQRIEAQAAEIERLRGHLEIWIFHNQRAMGQKPDDARAYAKAWLFRNANGEEPE